jgi:hypothetical protein
MRCTKLFIVKNNNKTQVYLIMYINSLRILALTNIECADLRSSSLKAQIVCSFTNTFYKWIYLLRNK